MGTSDRIERERQAKRTLILEAARELFLDRGYAAVTLREVAQRIEHSTTAVYVHFKDKRDLVEQMVAEDFSKFSAALHAVAPIEPPLLRLQRLAEAYVDFALTLPRHYQLLFLTPSPVEVEKPHVKQPIGLDGFGLLLGTVEACQAAGMFRSELGDPLALAQAVWAAVHGLVSLLIIKGGEPSFHWRSTRELQDTLLGSLLRGMMADPAAWPPAAQGPAAQGPAAEAAAERQTPAEGAPARPARRSRSRTARRRTAKAD